MLHSPPINPRPPTDSLPSCKLRPLATSGSLRRTILWPRVRFGCGLRRFGYWISRRAERLNDVAALIVRPSRRRAPGSMRRARSSPGLPDGTIERRRFGQRASLIRSTSTARCPRYRPGRRSDAAVEYAVEHLSAEFHGTCYWQFTASRRGRA